MLQAVSDELQDEDAEADVSVVPSPTSPPAISLLSPKDMETAGCILKAEELCREKAKVRDGDLRSNICVKQCRGGNI